MAAQYEADVSPCEPGQLTGAIQSAIARQICTASGFALQGPLAYAGLFPKQNNDYLAAGFVWSRPSAVMEPVVHANEYGFEVTYVLQLTPLVSLQPDLQTIWNPADNPAARNLIVQLQLNLAW